jgi:nucleoside-diphosphate-sugar epimerase
VGALRGRHEVIALSRASGDIANGATLRDLGPVDHAFHLAARTFVPASWADPVAFVQCNVVGTANVLAYCKRVSAPLTFVSAYIYGRAQQMPIREDAPPKPNNPYALSKHLAEQLCQFAAAHEGLRVTVVRPFNLYGPNQPDHFLIPTILRQVNEGSAIVLKDLSPKRDYLHLDDLVRLLVATLETDGASYRVVNAGSGTSYSVRQIAEFIQRAAGTALPVRDEGRPRYEEIDDVRADITAAGELFGWKPEIALPTGIARLVAPELR